MKIDTLISHLVTLGYPKTSKGEGPAFFYQEKDYPKGITAIKFFDSNCWILEFKAKDGIVFEINPAMFDVPETLGDVEAIIKQFLSDSINRQGAYAAFIGRESSNES